MIKFILPVFDRFQDYHWCVCFVLHLAAFFNFESAGYFPSTIVTDAFNNSIKFYFQTQKYVRFAHLIYRLTIVWGGRQFTSLHRSNFSAEKGQYKEDDF